MASTSRTFGGHLSVALSPTCIHAILTSRLQAATSSVAESSSIIDIQCFKSLDSLLMPLVREQTEFERQLQHRRPSHRHSTSRRASLHPRSHCSTQSIPPMQSVAREVAESSSVLCNGQHKVLTSNQHVSKDVRINTLLRHWFDITVSQPPVTQYQQCVNVSYAN